MDNCANCGNVVSRKGGIRKYGNVFCCRGCAKQYHEEVVKPRWKGIRGFTRRFFSGVVLGGITYVALNYSSLTTPSSMALMITAGVAVGGFVFAKLLGWLLNFLFDSGIMNALSTHGDNRSVRL